MKLTRSPSPRKLELDLDLAELALRSALRLDEPGRLASIHEFPYVGPECVFVNPVEVRADDVAGVVDRDDERANRARNVDGRKSPISEHESVRQIRVRVHSDDGAAIVDIESARFSRIGHVDARVNVIPE